MGSVFPLWCSGTEGPVQVVLCDVYTHTVHLDESLKWEITLFVYTMHDGTSGGCENSWTEEGRETVFCTAVQLKHF